MTNSKHITSLANPLIKEIVQLKNNQSTPGLRLTPSEKIDTKKELYITEGLRAVESVLSQNKSSIKYIFVLEQFSHLFSHTIESEKLITVIDHVMQKISSLTTPPGILAVCEYQFAKNIPEAPGIVCYEISDPGNLGTLFRTAAALNIKNVICIGGVNPLNQKVIQASAGTLPLLNIYKMTEVAFLKTTRNSEIIALTPDGNKDINEIQKNKNRFLVIGNEAHGLPENFVAQCSQSVKINMPGKAESLNAAVAGSIAMYYMF